MAKPAAMVARLALVLAFGFVVSACATHRITEPSAEHLAYVQTTLMRGTRVLRCGRVYEVGDPRSLLRQFGEVFPPSSPSRGLGEDAERQSRIALGYGLTGSVVAGVGFGLIAAGELSVPRDQTMLWTGFGVAFASAIPIVIAGFHQRKALVAFEDTINQYNAQVADDPSRAQCDTYTWPDPPPDFE